MSRFEKIKSQSPFLRHASWLGVVFVLSGCEIGVNILSPTEGGGPQGSVMKNPTAPSSNVYTSAALSTQPVFGVYAAGSSTPDTALTDSITLQAYLDSNCSITPGDGTLSAARNPLPLSSGLASFSGVSYTLPGHLEETIYLQASDQQSGISICTSGIAVLQHFNVGVGYVVSGTTGAAGGTEEDETEWDTSYATTIDSQGRILVAGSSQNNSCDDGYCGTEAAIWRYNPDGTLDSTFGTGGVMVSGTIGAAGATGSDEDDEAYTLLVDSQGRIIVAGSSAYESGAYELAIWRLTSSGALDTSFGGGGTGYVVSGTTGAAGATGGSEPGNEDDEAGGMQFDSSGRIIIAGDSKNPSGGHEITIWRYTSNGILDTSFGSGNGYVLSGAVGAAGGTGGQEADDASALQIDSNHGFVIAGDSGTYGYVSIELAIWRFTPSGVLDSTFGTGGVALFGTTGAAGGTGSNEMDIADGMQLDSQGRIVAAGYSQNNSCGPYCGTEAAIWRFTSTGVLDTSFGGGNGYIVSGPSGIADGATGSAEYDGAFAIDLDSQGNIVLTGQSYDQNDNGQLAVWRYTPSGALDTSFGGGNGYITSGPYGAADGSTDGNENDYGQAIAIDSHGRIVIAGVSVTNYLSDPELAIWRYTSSGSLDE